MIANPEAFMVIITTQSDKPPAGAFKAELDYARGVRDGRIVEDGAPSALAANDSKYRALLEADRPGNDRTVLRQLRERRAAPEECLSLRVERPHRRKACGP